MTLDQLKEQKQFLEEKIKQLDAKQLCIKIFVNACFGYFANKAAPMGDDDIASSITLTGQATIKKSSDIAKEYAKSKGVTDSQLLEAITIYSDTDSIYMSFKSIINKLKIPFIVNGKVNKEVHTLVEEFNDKLNNDTKKWMESSLNSKDCRLEFKRESIADYGLFLEKKRYVVHVLDDEGFECDKWKYTGVDVVRTTMPKAIKPYVKKIIEMMISSKDLGKTNKLLNEAYDVFKELPTSDIAFVKGIKGLHKYGSQCKEFSTVKRMPIHVKAAYFHNLMLDKYGIAGQYEKINDGDKTRFYYTTQPNKYGIESIGFKYILPEEFLKDFPVDREKMFEKIVFAAISRFYEAVNWQPRKPNDQVVLDILDYFS